MECHFFFIIYLYKLLLVYIKLQKKNRFYEKDPSFENRLINTMFKFYIAFLKNTLQKRKSKVKIED